MPQPDPSMIFTPTKIDRTSASLRDKAKKALDYLKAAFSQGEGLKAAVELRKHISIGMQQLIMAYSEHLRDANPEAISDKERRKSLKDRYKGNKEGRADAEKLIMARAKNKLHDTYNFEIVTESIIDTLKELVSSYPCEEPWFASGIELTINRIWSLYLFELNTRYFVLDSIEENRRIITKAQNNHLQRFLSSHDLNPIQLQYRFTEAFNYVELNFPDKAHYSSIRPDTKPPTTRLIAMYKEFYFAQAKEVFFNINDILNDLPTLENESEGQNLESKNFSPLNVKDILYDPISDSGAPRTLNDSNKPPKPKDWALKRAKSFMAWLLNSGDSEFSSYFLEEDKAAVLEKRNEMKPIYREYTHFIEQTLSLSGSYNDSNVPTVTPKVNCLTTTLVPSTIVSSTSTTPKLTEESSSEQTIISTVEHKELSSRAQEIDTTLPKDHSFHSSITTDVATHLPTLPSDSYDTESSTASTSELIAGSYSEKTITSTTNSAINSTITPTITLEYRELNDRSTANSTNILNTTAFEESKSSSLGGIVGGLAVGAGIAAGGAAIGAGLAAGAGGAGAVAGGLAAGGAAIGAGLAALGAEKGSKTKKVREEILDAMEDAADGIEAAIEAAPTRASTSSIATLPSEAISKNNGNIVATSKPPLISANITSTESHNMRHLSSTTESSTTEEEVNKTYTTTNIINPSNASNNSNIIDNSNINVSVSSNISTLAPGRKNSNSENWEVAQLSSSLASLYTNGLTSTASILEGSARSSFNQTTEADNANDNTNNNTSNDTSSFEEKDTELTYNINNTQHNFSSTEFYTPSIVTLLEGRSFNQSLSLNQTAKDSNIIDDRNNNGTFASVEDAENETEEENQETSSNLTTTHSTMASTASYTTVDPLETAAEVRTRLLMMFLPRRLKDFLGYDIISLTFAITGGTFKDLPEIIYSTIKAPIIAAARANVPEGSDMFEAALESGNFKYIPQQIEYELRSIIRALSPTLPRRELVIKLFEDCVQNIWSLHLFEITELYKGELPIGGAIEAEYKRYFSGLNEIQLLHRFVEALDYVKENFPQKDQLEEIGREPWEAAYRPSIEKSRIEIYKEGLRGRAQREFTRINEGFNAIKEAHTKDLVRSYKSFLETQKYPRFDWILTAEAERYSRMSDGEFMEENGKLASWLATAPEAEFLACFSESDRPRVLEERNRLKSTYQRYSDFSKEIFSPENYTSQSPRRLIFKDGVLQKSSIETTKLSLKTADIAGQSAESIEVKTPVSLSLSLSSFPADNSLETEDKPSHKLIRKARFVFGSNYHPASFDASNSASTNAGFINSFFSSISGLLKLRNNKNPVADKTPASLPLSSFPADRPTQKEGEPRQLLERQARSSHSRRPIYHRYVKNSASTNNDAGFINKIVSSSLKLLRSLSLTNLVSFAAGPAQPITNGYNTLNIAAETSSPNEQETPIATSINPELPELTSTLNLVSWGLSKVVGGKLPHFTTKGELTLDQKQNIKRVINLDLLAAVKENCLTSGIGVNYLNGTGIEKLSSRISSDILNGHQPNISNFSANDLLISWRSRDSRNLQLAKVIDKTKISLAEITSHSSLDSIFERAGVPLPHADWLPPRQAETRGHSVLGFSSSSPGTLLTNAGSERIANSSAIRTG